MPNRNNAINPLVTLLFNRMVFIAWKSYSILKLTNAQTPRTEYEEDSEYQSNEDFGADDFVDNNDFNDDEQNSEGERNQSDEAIEEMEEDDFSPDPKGN